MRNSIAIYKESLSRIASDVQGAAEELEIHGPQIGEDAAVSDRRISHRFAQSTSPSGSPIVNGFDRGSRDEIEQHKAEIQRLQTSEAEVKALAVNYAAILKEKEEQLSRLHEENSSLRKSFETKTAVAHISKDENFRISTNNTISVKRTADLSPNRQHRYTSQVNSRSSGINGHKSIISKQDMSSNGSVQVSPFDGIQRKMDLTVANSHGNDKELPKSLEENNRALLAVQANHELEIKQLRVQLESECENSANVEKKFQEEHKQNESFQREIHHLKMEMERSSLEMKELHRELSAKISEVRQLQLELNRRGSEEQSNESLERLKNAVLALEKENSNLKMEKDELEAALKLHAERRIEKTEGYSEKQVKNSSNLDEVEEMTTRILHLEKTLEVTHKERDRASQELTRLKQHLLDKELEESDKMDEDSKIIDELRANSEYQRSHILQLEKALRQEKAKHEETKKTKIDELQASNEIINGLKHKLANYMSTVEAKNVELLNLETALGQYYAETEAKERLERDVGAAREELSKLSEALKAANQQQEISKKEKEEILLKLSQAERMLSEGKLTVQKLQEDNSKLRRTLEQSMTRINRMSIDSDYYVDRRIVIKLLVTYFQRNHSKEVLDLMVRMLGFSEEDKQRIGFAQQVVGKGVVRGVLGLPGRLVGGILGGSSHEVSSHTPSENQSFADLWVDFLLKETEERERRELAEASKASSSKQERSTGTTRMSSVPEYRTSMPGSSSSFPTVQSPVSPVAGPIPSKQNQLFEHSNAEFATVPLTSSISPPPENSYRFSRLPPRF